VLAAAGLVALSDGPDGMIARLAEDHLTARRLADGVLEWTLADLPLISTPDTSTPATGSQDVA